MTGAGRDRASSARCSRCRGSTTACSKVSPKVRSRLRAKLGIDLQAGEGEVLGIVHFLRGRDVHIEDFGQGNSGDALTDSAELLVRESPFLPFAILLVHAPHSVVE